MVKFVISTAFLLAANAVGLLVAAVVLADMEVGIGSFVIAVAIFTAVTAVVRPFIMKLALKHFEALMGGTALVSTLVGLVLTSILASGFTIRGAGTWLMATMIVWITAMLAGVALPAIFLKRQVEQRRADGDRRVGS